jgi:hypothetical protein
MVPHRERGRMGLYLRIKRVGIEPDESVAAEYDPAVRSETFPNQPAQRDACQIVHGLVVD